MNASAAGGPPDQPERSLRDIGALQGLVDFLVGDGVRRGVIGPREGAVVWERHVGNAAAGVGLVEPQASVVDVGSGGGLPGLVLAVLRDDIWVTCLDRQSRRVRFIADAVAHLDALDPTLRLAERVDVLHGRAPDAVAGRQWHHVTSRALADLTTLYELCLPLVAPGGSCLCWKGETVSNELATSPPPTPWEAELCRPMGWGHQATILRLRRSPDVS